MAKNVTENDKKKILELYDNGGYTDAEIGEEVNLSTGIVGYWIRKLRGSRRTGYQDKKPKKSKGAQPKGSTHTQKPKPVKKYNLTIKEKNLSKEVLDLLHKCNSHDEFVRGYYKIYGLDCGTGVHMIVQMWTHRDSILLYEQEKEQERKRKELLAVTGAAKHPVKEEPIKNDKRSAFADEGEQLVKINHRLSEMIAITEEVLKVQKDTYILFKEKLDGGKKHDGDSGKTPTAQT